MNCADRAISLQGSSSRTDAIADSHGSRKPTTSGSRLPNCRLVRGAGPSRDTAGYASGGRRQTGLKERINLELGTRIIPLSFVTLHIREPIQSGAAFQSGATRRFRRPHQR